MRFGEGLTDNLEQLRSNSLWHNSVDWAMEPDPGHKPEFFAVLVH